jgi:hypothetical protein
MASFPAPTASWLSILAAQIRFGPCGGTIFPQELDEQTGFFHAIPGHSLPTLGIRIKLDQEDDICDEYLGFSSYPPGETSTPSWRISL